MNEILLSICIPTYNRCEILRETLMNIFEDPDYDPSLVEVIVSDNCSSDETEKVVKEFKNVIYKRNDSNIKDDNFSKVLSYGRGEYLKLLNDTQVLKPGTLKFFLEKIELHLNTKENILFYLNYYRHQDCKITSQDIEGFINAVSYFNTWVANYGVWRSDFEDIADKNRYSKLQFVQVDWSFKTAKSNKVTIVYFGDYFKILTPKVKGGYNLIKTFTRNYLDILKGEKISLFQYEKEKYFLCRYFLFSWLTEILITDKSRYNFQSENALFIIFRRYWYEPYYYILICVFAFKKFKLKLNDFGTSKG